MSELKKEISVWKGTALAVCIVIGSGLLGLPGITLEIGNVYSVAGGWLLITLAMVPFIYIFAKLGLRFTSTAGLARYAKEAVGPWGDYGVTAILCGTFIIGIPVVAWVGGSYVQKLLNLPPGTACWLAIGILVLATVINLLGVRAVNLINIASLTALVIMMLMIVFLNIPFFGRGLVIFRESLLVGDKIDFHDLWRIVMVLFWAFLGWENLSFSLEEFKKPERSIPGVYWLSFLVVICLYFGLIITSLGAQISGVSVKGPAGLTSLVGGRPGGNFLLLMMVLVIPANVTAWIFGAARLYYSAGLTEILPKFLGRLSASGLPLNSLLCSLAVYVVATLTTYYLNIPLANLVMIVNQNWLVLYIFSILAYWKTEENRWRWFITVLASLSCLFLLAGFSWWIAYPLILLAIGYFRFRAINGNENANCHA